MRRKLPDMEEKWTFQFWNHIWNLTSFSCTALPSWSLIPLGNSIKFHITTGMWWTSRDQKRQHHIKHWLIQYKHLVYFPSWDPLIRWKRTSTILWEEKKLSYWLEHPICYWFCSTTGICAAQAGFELPILMSPPPKHSHSTFVPLLLTMSQSWSAGHYINSHPRHFP